MKPKRIILVRHGESVGNANPVHYETVQDWSVSLTALGQEQAKSAGRKIREVIGSESVYAYLSPWYRARETFEAIVGELGDRVVRAIEDPRLREQEFGHLRAMTDNMAIKKERIEFGTFYYRIPDGESGADVYDRISTFLETLHRDFGKVSYPENALVVTHGVALRVFLMRWFHWTVEEYESIRNPANGAVVIMEKKDGGRYRIFTPLETRV
ncbi:MAG: histidine phosphatase family protein [Candidatus Thiodiazotropha sp. (ex Lucinoma borealis)]|nr:histidine phosphatase family protein [Candidatus Thiodiazotropha sp. (ex Lucinoma borealis)]